MDRYLLLLPENLFSLSVVTPFLLRSVEFFSFCCSPKLKTILFKIFVFFVSVQVSPKNDKNKQRKKSLPYTPCPLNTLSDSLPRNYSYIQASRLYNEAPKEIRDANLLTTTGVLPLTLRVGNPIAMYKLKKIKIPHPIPDHVYLHMEKYCALDALWYLQWMKLSFYCEMFRDFMYGVIKAFLELPERAIFLLTMTRILALPDKAPGFDGNFLSTRFQWRAPLHQYLWRELQQGETPSTPHFLLYPQPPQRQPIDSSRFQRAMLAHNQPTAASSSLSCSESVISTLSETASSVAASTIAASHTSAQASVVSEAEQNITVESYAESVDTTVAVVFGPVVKMKKAQEKKKTTAMAPESSNSTS